MQRFRSRSRSRGRPPNTSASASASAFNTNTNTNTHNYHNINLDLDGGFDNNYSSPLSYQQLQLQQQDYQYKYNHHYHPHSQPQQSQQQSSTTLSRKPTLKVVEKRIERLSDSEDSEADEYYSSTNNSSSSRNAALPQRSKSFARKQQPIVTPSSSKLSRSNSLSRSQSISKSTPPAILPVSSSNTASARNSVSISRASTTISPRTSRSDFNHSFHSTLSLILFPTSHFTSFDALPGNDGHIVVVDVLVVAVQLGAVALENWLAQTEDDCVAEDEFLGRKPCCQVELLEDGRKDQWRWEEREEVVDECSHEERERHRTTMGAERPLVPSSHPPGTTIDASLLRFSISRQRRSRSLTRSAPPAPKAFGRYYQQDDPVDEERHVVEVQQRSTSKPPEERGRSEKEKSKVERRRSRIRREDVSERDESIYSEEAVEDGWKEFEGRRRSKSIVRVAGSVDRSRPTTPIGPIEPRETGIATAQYRSAHLHSRIETNTQNSTYIPPPGPIEDEEDIYTRVAEPPVAPERKAVPIVTPERKIVPVPVKMERETKDSGYDTNNFTEVELSDQEEPLREVRESPFARVPTIHMLTPPQRVVPNPKTIAVQALKEHQVVPMVTVGTNGTNVVEFDERLFGMMPGRRVRERERSWEKGWERKQGAEKFGKGVLMDPGVDEKEWMKALTPNGTGVAPKSPNHLSPAPLPVYGNMRFISSPMPMTPSPSSPSAAAANLPYEAAIVPVEEPAAKGDRPKPKRRNTVLPPRLSLDVNTKGDGTKGDGQEGTSDITMMAITDLASPLPPQ
ncbi:hypothetical protein HDU97_001678 [Phlyctochytrium planicorne]|nr:hypothetical protein HDU97_001678 [Phlyctochytrium planicorne]